MVSIRRYVAPIASATPRASTDFPEPGSPANTTKSLTPARYREKPRLADPRPATGAPYSGRLLRGLPAVACGPARRRTVRGSVMLGDVAWRRGAWAPGCLRLAAAGVR